MEKIPSNKRIFTAAVTGAIHTPSMSPHLPVTADEIIADVMSVYDAGGAVAHVHVRDEQSGIPNADQKTFKYIASEVKKRCDIVLRCLRCSIFWWPDHGLSPVVAQGKIQLAGVGGNLTNFSEFVTDFR